MGAYCWSGSVNGLNSSNSGSWTSYIPESTGKLRVTSADPRE